MHLVRELLLLCAVAGLVVGGVSAQIRPAAAEGEEKIEQYLGDYFVSRTAGIAFRPPIRGTQIKPAVVGTNIVQYVNPDEKWAMRVSQMVFEKPAAMVAKDNPATPLVDESTTEGVLLQTAQQLVLQNGGSKLLRQDVINVGKNDTGMIILRYTQGSQTYLRQAALIQRTDQHYYVFDLTSPSSKASTEAEENEEPSEVMAVRILNAILDSVQLLDLRLIEADITARLYASRALMVNLAKRTKQVVLPEQYFRVLKNGKDVGWSFVAEDPGQRLGEDGVFVAISSQSSAEGGAKVNVSSEMFCADTRRNEAWVTITVVEKDGKKEQTSEFGQSERRILRKLEARDGGDKANPNQPTMRTLEQHLLNVTQTNKASATPIKRELSAHYLPAALGYLLPRLVSVKEAKGYVFLVWVGGERELVNRYIDVEPERTATFAGKQIRAAVIKDRLGLEGEPTYHYVTATGQYLGSETPARGMAVVATDAKMIGQIWPGAQIVRAHVLDSATDRVR